MNETFEPLDALRNPIKIGSRYGYILKDWSGRFEGDPSTLPKIPDDTKFWTYHECKKNNKGLKFLNITGECQGFERIK